MTTRVINNVIALKAQRILQYATKPRDATTVMGTPPTITVGTSGANSTIVTDIGTTPQIVPPDTRLRYVNANGSWANTSGFVNPTFMTEVNAQASPGCGFEFWTDAEAVEFNLRDGGNNACRVFVDGQLTASADTTLPTNTFGNNYYVKYSFGTGNGKPRRIEFRINGGSHIRGFNIGKSAGTLAAANPYRIWRPSDNGEPRVILRGDSYGQMPFGGITSMGSQLSFALGMQTLMDQSVGGQGFISASTNSTQTAIQQIADLQALGANLDLLILTYGYNDNGQTLGNIQTAATTYLAACRAAQPNAIIAVIGPWQTPSHGASTPHAALSAAVTAFADRSTFFVDTQTAPAWQDTSGLNSTLYIGGDNVHPNAAGATYIARRIADGITSNLATLAGVS